MLPSNYTSIHGWCSIDKAQRLMKIVDDITPSLVVELGVFGGRSLLPLALAAKNNNLSCKVIGIDSWSAQASLEGKNDKANDDWWASIDYEGMYKYTNDLMIKNGVSSVVELWKNKSRDVISKFKDESIDILHQDSNHSEETTCEEVELYWNKVRVGGMWIFDDTNWPTTKKAQQMLVNKNYKEIYESPVTDTSSSWKVFCRSE